MALLTMVNVFKKKLKKPKKKLYGLKYYFCYS